jgi:hypothetical protein
MSDIPEINIIGAAIKGMDAITRRASQTDKLLSASEKRELIATWDKHVADLCTASTTFTALTAIGSDKNILSGRIFPGFRRHAVSVWTKLVKQQISSQPTLMRVHARFVRDATGRKMPGLLKAARQIVADSKRPVRRGVRANAAIKL